VLNEGRTIHEVVGAMTRQRIDGTVEFIFADGGSTDDTKAKLEQLARADPRIRVLENRRRGVASGLNVCLGAARGKYVARMDGHALYPATYLRDGIERLERTRDGTADGYVAWVAGPQIPEPRGRVAAAIAAALGTWLGQGGSRRWQGSSRAAQEYDLDTGVFCGVWRREDLITKGGWDEDWRCNEDSELAARFHDAGQRIVCMPMMAARYIPRGSFPALWQQYLTYGIYRAKTARRHPRSLRRSAVLPPLLVLNAAASLLAPASLRRVPRAGLAAYAAALSVATAQTARQKDGPVDVVDLLAAPALLTMHLANGVGFLIGCARWGVPWRALSHVAGGGGEHVPYRGPVHAPSLQPGRG
jgi:succinoglycan biosynthesis protein ExoA